MDHAEADELRVLEAGHEPEHPLLLAPLELGLETDHRVVAGGQVVLAKLDHCERTGSRARVL